MMTSSVTRVCGEEGQCLLKITNVIKRVKLTEEWRKECEP